MSTFLAPYFDNISLGYTVLQVQNVFVGNLTANGWQLLAQVDGVGGYSDLIPPATETTGTSTFREVVRIYFPDNVTVKIGSYQVCIADAFPQSIRLTAKTAGAVQAGVTINGVTVLGAMGSAGSTANDNLQALYYALMDSVNATITGWTFSYDGNSTLICTAKVPAAMVTCSGNANVNYFAHAQSVLAGARSGFVNVDVNYAYGVTVDLTNGFVYYMEVFSRSFSLSTKCLSGVYGSIGAVYTDHATALAVTPPGGLCSPIELVIVNLATMQGHTTHFWAECFNYGHKTVPNIETAQLLGWYDGTPEWHPFTGAGFPNMVSDCGLVYDTTTVGSIYGVQVGLLELGIAGAGTNLDIYKVTPVSVATFASTESSYYQGSVRFAPPIDLSDLHRWGGSEPNEASAMCKLVPPPASYPTLAQVLDTSTAYITINLSSTANIPPSGALTIGTEEITYTGVSGPTITGVSMAQNGTVRARHFVGDVCSPVTWFLKVNNAAICCGSNKPV